MRGVLFGLLTIVGIVLTLWAVGQWRWSSKTSALLEALEATRVGGPPEVFDPAELRSLPEPVVRHLLQVLPAGTPMIRAAEIVHRGTFNLSPTGETWKPFTSRQRVVTRRPGFVWDGRVSVAPGLAVHVHDAYVDGEGILEPAFLGLHTLSRVRDRGEVARGELMRFLAEAAWYPTALLPSQGVQWTPIDASSARATLIDGPLGISMTFHFGSDGLIDTLSVEDRGRAIGDRIVPTPWEGRMSDYQRRDGMLIPLQAEVAWLTPEGRRPYWRGTVTEIDFRR
jgi:hypothetical protein